MPLTAGTRLGPYEIVGPIGAGGMGEVFKARDTRLERSVAIKLLPAELSRDAQLRLRFEREARTISQLNDPHICTLYDVGSENGRDYLVMELLEGETLADRLARGPMPIADVLRYGAQIAQALDRAHRSGVVHRDLKPGNVMLTRSGAKLLDFGLAKSAAGAGEAVIFGSATQATEHKPLTREGTILGTFQYMAPEQLEGREADARTDIFALGAVLYEMATGRRAFDGKTKTSLIAAIVDRNPTPISEVQPLTPAAFEHVVGKCLEKDPESRWQSAYDVAEELRWVASASTASAARLSAMPRRERLFWIAAVAIVAAVALYAMLRRQDRPASIPARVTLSMPGAATVSNVTVSPDGTSIAFTGETTDGRRLLWVRRLNALAATPLQNTDGAQYPFWSPDGRHVGFFAGGKLKKIDLAGGAPETLVTVSPTARGGAWSPNGTIVISPGGSAPLWAIPSAGGPWTELTQLDRTRGESTHRWPIFLPDGQRYLFLVSSFGTVNRQNEFGIYLGDLRSKEQKLLVRANSNVAYADGRLFYVRGGTLYAQPFDEDEATLEGEPVPLAGNVRYAPEIYRAQFSAGPGVLAYQSGVRSAGTQLTWFDRTGAQRGVLGERGRVGNPSISPDGERVAVDLSDGHSGNVDVWVLGARGEGGQRLTFGTAEETVPTWSRDGRSLYYITYKGGAQAIARTAADGGEEQILVDRNLITAGASDVGPDEGSLILETDDSGQSDIVLLRVDTGATTKLISTPASEGLARLSPDRRWLAFVSDETGRLEVYITAFPQSRAKWQVSHGGGSEPRWRSDGKELFYVDASKRIVAVDVQFAETPRIGTPRPLFRAPLRDPISGTDVWSYDVSRDGQSFLVNAADPALRDVPVTLWLNWTSPEARATQR